jgi:hypothetical protein
LAKFLIMRKGGGGKVAINPDLVTHIRSANGAFTDVFFEGQQVAVEGAFEDVVRQLSAVERRTPPAGAQPRADDTGLVFGRVDR